MPALLREVLVNYASNMVRIRVKHRTIFWKRGEPLHCFDKRICTARTSEWTSVKEPASMFSETRSGWIEHRFSNSSSISLKGCGSYGSFQFWHLSLDILDFRKQFTTVFFFTASQAATKICIPSSKEILGRVIFFSTLWITLTVLRFYWANLTLVQWPSLRSCVRWEEKELNH